MIANGWGSTLEEERGSAGLMMRLEDPATLDALHRLLDHVDVIAFAAQAADGVMRRSETIADSITDSMKDVKRLAASAEPLAGLVEHLPQLAATGSKVAELSSTAAFQNLADSGLFERLGDPKTIESVHSLLDHLPLAAFSLEMIDSFLRRGEQVMDNISGLFDEARKTGEGLQTENLQTIKEGAQTLLDTARQLKESGVIAELPKLTETFGQLVRSGIFEPKTVAVLAEVGNMAAASYRSTKANPPAPVSPLGLYKALKDPDIQRTLGFMLGVAKQYGQLMH